MKTYPPNHHSPHQDDHQTDTDDALLSGLLATPLPSVSSPTRPHSIWMSSGGQEPKESDVLKDLLRSIRSGQGSGDSGRPPGAPIESQNIKGGAAAVAIGMLALIVVLAIINSYTVIDAGTRGVVKTFGEVTQVLSEGLHFRIPFVTSVVYVDVKTQKQQSDVEASSRDLQRVQTTVVLNYRPEPDKVGELVRNIGPDYVNIIIEPAIQESVKAATAQFTAEQLITQRPDVREAIRVDLEGRLNDFDIRVQEVSITNFSFSPDFSNAIEAKQVAEQDALRAKQELERARIQAQQRVAQAEAEAEARLRVAQAEAEALRLQREVISPELLHLRFIENWNGSLPTFLSGNSALLPIEQAPTE